MSTLPAEIYSVATVRDIDRAAIEDRGICGYTLMSRAAAFTVACVQREYPNARHWQILCGAGNNAGDGYVAARLARAAGIDVSVTTVVDPEKLSGDAATAFADFVAAGGIPEAWQGSLDAKATLFIDALLGSGLDRDLGGDFAAAVAALNEVDKQVVALDISTGLHGDSGQVLGDAVRADLTVTFVGLKQGHFLGSGPEYRGKLLFTDLEIPAACYANKAVAMRRISAEQPASLLPRRDRTAHKGNYGHVVLIGGGAGMPGAAVLAGEAALRTGAGRVSVATDPAHATDVVNARPELMARGVRDASDLQPYFDTCSVIAVGPGLGQSDWAASLMHAVSGQTLPAVWDADALNWLAEHPSQQADRIITPHPGEAATLLGTTTAKIQADRKAAVTELQQRFGGVALLKGAGSLVKGPGPDVWVSASGNPGMAAPGMGDVLTGIIAALLAQGLSLIDAATSGVELHAQLGDLAAMGGERGMLASDLLTELRGLVN